VCGSADCWEYTFIYFTKKDVTHIPSVFRWGASCVEVLSIIQFQVFPWMGCFSKRVLIKFDENWHTECVEKLILTIVYCVWICDNNLSFEGIISNIINRKTVYWGGWYVEMRRLC